MSGLAPRTEISSIRLWAGIAISIVCVILVARRIDWPAFVDALRTVRPAWVAAAAVMTAGGYVCSGLRWRQVVAPQAAMTRRDAYDVVVIGNLANLVGPSRAGDLARAALVSRRCSIPVSRLLGAIAVERYVDAVMLVVVALALSAAVRFPAAVRAGVLALATMGLAVIIVVAVASDRLPAIAASVVGVVAPSWGAAIRNFLAGLFDGIRTAVSVRRFLGTFAWTMAIWSFSAASIWCGLRAFDLSAPWYAAFFVVVVINLGGVIPASPGSIGVYHFLAVTALSVWIPDAARPLGFAVVTHATGLAVVTVLGLLGLASQHETLFRVERAANIVLDGAGREDRAVR